MQELSPQQLKKLEKLAKVLDNGDIELLNQLDNLETELTTKIEAVASQIPALRQAKDGERGIQGERGMPGVDGKDGKDGIDGKDGKNGADGKNGLPGVDGKDGKDGKDGDIKDLSPQEIRDSLELLQGEERLKASAIDGLDKEVTDRAIGIVDQRTSFLINRINNLPTNSSSVTIKDVFGITVDGADVVLTTGTKGFRYIEQDCTITGWSVVSDATGSVVFDVKRGGVSIAGTEKPTLSDASSSTDLSLSTWTTGLVAGDIIEFIIDSASTITRATLTILITKI